MLVIFTPITLRRSCIQGLDGVPFKKKNMRLRGLKNRAMTFRNTEIDRITYTARSSHIYKHYSWLSRPIDFLKWQLIATYQSIATPIDCLSDQSIGPSSSLSSFSNAYTHPLED